MTVLADFSFRLGNRSFAPLVCGGMGVDISSPELALELARHGAIGHISDAMAPYVSDKRYGTHFQAAKRRSFGTVATFEPRRPGVQWSADDVYRACRSHAGNTMSKKGEKPGLIFVNVMEKLTMGAPAETMQARLRGALDGGIDGITLSAGLHLGTLKLIEDEPRYRDVFIGIIVSSSRALKIFLRAAGRAGRLPDYIVVEGPLAGGHLGFGEDWQEQSLERILEDVLGLLRAEGLDIPVIPAGGIFTCEDAVRLMEQGASAVQVATRFAVTRESGLPEAVKQRYVKAEAEDVVVNTASPTGYLMRMLKDSPSQSSGVKPNCEALGYMLDSEGKCAYRDAYFAALDGTPGPRKVEGKMCICHHFMKSSCYTCGQNVSRLKDVIERTADGSFRLPSAQEVISSYLYGAD